MISMMDQLTQCYDEVLINKTKKYLNVIECLLYTQTHTHTKDKLKSMFN